MKKSLLIWLLTLCILGAFAQEENQETSEVEQPANEMQWYNSPLVWIAGAGGVLFLLVGLTRGGTKSQE